MDDFAKYGRATQMARGLALILRHRAARRAGVAPDRIKFGAGNPAPRLKNEDGSMDFGDIFVGAGCRLWAHKSGSLTIGEDTYLDEKVEIIAWDQVTIGGGCFLGNGALVMDSDLHSVAGNPVSNQPVNIGDNVYIGCRSIILKGVTVGHDAVIRPGTIVTKNVAAGCKIGPPPARVIT